MRKALLVSLFLIVIASIAFIACSEEEENPTLNVTSLTATPDSLGEGDTASVTATVNYNGDNTITYAWSCDGGSINGTGSSVSWIAPTASGNFNVFLTAADGVVSDDEIVLVKVGAGNTISIYQPTDGATLDEVAIVRTNVDPLPDSVIFVLGSLTPITDCSMPFEATFDISSLGDGNYSVNATAFWGSKIESDNVTVNIENTSIDPAEEIIGDWERSVEFADSLWNDEGGYWEYDYFWFSFVIKFRDTGRYQIEVIGYGTSDYGSYSIAGNNMTLTDDASGGVGDVYSFSIGTGSDIVSFSEISVSYYEDRIAGDAIPGTWTKRF